MSRLIDSGNVHGYLLEYAYAHQADLGFRWGDIIKFTPSQVADILAKMSTIDAVEVVRCKDCAKREYCRTTNVWATVPDDDWFCADAERRSDE